MAFNKNQLKIKRRTLLSGVGAAMGGSALMTQLGSAHPTRLTEFVGKSYDPLSDQEQADASAELLFTPFGAIGELSVAGFTIPIGKENPLTPIGSKGGIDTYAFVKDGAEFTVRDRVGGRVRELPLIGRFDVVNGQIVGSLRRPTAEWGEISFTLVPEDHGISGEELSTALGLKKPPEVSLYDDPGGIPDRGIPTCNSIANAPVTDDIEASMWIPAPPGGGGGAGGGGGGGGGDPPEDPPNDPPEDPPEDPPDYNPEPDLNVTYAGRNPTSPDVCGTLEVVFTVKNEGAGTAHDETCKIKADWLKSDEFVSVAEGGLAPGDTEEHSREIKAPYRSPDGNRNPHEIVVSVARDPSSAATTIYPQLPADVCDDGDCDNEAAYLAVGSQPQASFPEVDYTEQCKYFLGTAAKIDYASSTSPGPRVSTEAGNEIAKDAEKRFYLEGAFETVPKSPIRDCHMVPSGQEHGGCWDPKDATAYQTSVEFSAKVVDTNAHITHYWPDGTQNADEGKTWREYLSDGLDIVRSFVKHPLADAGLKAIGYGIQTEDPGYEVTEEDKTDDGDLKEVSWELPLPKTKDERTGSIHFPNRTGGEGSDEGDEVSVSFKVKNKESARETGTIRTKSAFNYTVGVYDWEQHSKDEPPSCDKECGNSEIVTFARPVKIVVSNEAKYRSVAENSDNPCIDDGYDQ
ncbi:MAG TPA: hypothetical protein VJ898_07830 [Natrialbaceae archaeon]|nr:hypothetical protein [Natrialbaceae archaeon]